jgi:hypothetical protein
MSRNNRAELKEKILSPGFPDRERDARYEYGILRNFRKLAHYTDASDADLVINQADVGVASLIDNTKVVYNAVPNPENPADLVQIDNEMSLIQIRDHVLEDVFMIGRTSGFVRGRLITTDIREFAVKMPNNRNYMYGGLAMVEANEPRSRFSRSGDSGALVYAKVGGKYLALGFVVGGNDKQTFVCPVTTSLKAMGATLL